MNTNKQINIMVLLVFLAVFATGAYTLWDPNRADNARDKQREATLMRGAFLFTQNCRVCHGNAGEGGSASNRLRAAPPLNRPDLQGRETAGGEVDETKKKQAYSLVFDTIVCGRVGKAMPTWGQEQGGTLNEEQIKQLSVFITEGDAWDLAEEFALEGVPNFDVHGDRVEGLALAAPLAEGDTDLVLTKPEGFGVGQRLKIADEIVQITEYDAATGAITVERGIGTTNAAAYEAGTEVLNEPSPPDPPSITQPACGQLLPPPVEDGPADPPSADLTIIAQGIAWNKKELSAIADVPLTITVDNRDAGVPHNIHFTVGNEPGGEEVAATAIENGPVTQTLNFGPLGEGEYFYVCDVHLNMEGVLTAVPASEAPAAGATPGTQPVEPTPEPEGT